MALESQGNNVFEIERKQNHQIERKRENDALKRAREK